MSMNQFDLNSLQSRINEIKKEGEEVSDFTIQYLSCLMNRHDLQHAIPDEYDFGDVPESILQKLRSGEIPTEEEIKIIDVETQNFLCFELVFLCGLCAIARYGGTEPVHTEDGESDSVWDVIWQMRSLSEYHNIATYIITALTLLMGQIPSQQISAQMVFNIADDDNQLQRNMDYFVELCSAILTRYVEDAEYYK
jgi:hypothetical protein